MRAQLTNRDYEQLSAYIDGQLSPAERTKLEERLRMHADLQVALDEISRTKALLRSAPRRRAPRNFTLSPAMVGQQKQQQKAPWWNLFPVLGFTSALATLVLVATIVFQLLPGQSEMLTTAMQPPQADQVANIVEQTMTAMQITMPAAQPAQPAAGTPSPEQGGIGNAREARTATPRMELFVPPAATATEAAVMAAPVTQATPTPEPAKPAAEAPAALDQAVPQDTPPVVAWGNDSVNPGMGGMGGGGAGPEGTAGSLLGPPAAENAAEGTLMGKGGGGGGTEGMVVPGENIVIPPESVTSETEDASAQSQLETVPNEPVPAPAQPNPQITGTGPILGVPSAEEGGQIVERKAILGQPGAPQNDSPEKPRSGVDVNQPADPSDKSAQPASPQSLFGLPLLLVLQFLLGLIAIATGVAAFIIRKRAR